MTNVRFFCGFYNFVLLIQEYIVSKCIVGIHYCDVRRKIMDEPSDIPTIVVN